MAGTYARRRTQCATITAGAAQDAGANSACRKVAVSGAADALPGYLEGATPPSVTWAARSPTRKLGARAWNCAGLPELLKRPSNGFVTSILE